MNYLLELDKRLKQPDNVEALLEFKSLFKEHPQTIEPGLIKLSEYFSTHSVYIIQILQDLDIDSPIFVKKMVEYLDSNDPILRAMTLRLLGKIKADSHELRYNLMCLLKSDATGHEWNAMKYCINRICQKNELFAIHVLRVIYHRVNTEQEDPLRFAGLYSILYSISFDDFLEALGIAQTLVGLELEDELVLSIYISMTKMVSEHILWVNDHINYLIDSVQSRKPSIQLGLIECLIYLATKHSFHFDPPQIKSIFDMLPLLSWPCKSRVAQCLCLCDCEIDGILDQCYSLLELGLDENIRYCFPIARLAKQVYPQHDNPATAQSKLKTYMDMLLRDLKTYPRIKLKIAWLLVPIVPEQYLPFLISLTTEDTIGTIVSGYCKMYMKDVDLNSLVQYMQQVPVDIQLDIIRHTIPFGSSVAFTGVIDQLDTLYLYDIGLVLLSRGHAHVACGVFERLAHLDSPNFGHWFSFLISFCQAESMDEENWLLPFFNAQLQLQSFVQATSFQFIYFDLQIQYITVLYSLLQKEPLEDNIRALLSIKDGFSGLLTSIQMDPKGKDVIGYYLYQLDLLMGFKPICIPSNTFYEHQMKLNNYSSQELPFHLLQSRPHPYCFFILPEPVECHIETIPEVKVNSTIVVPKHLDFTLTVQGTVSINEYMDRLKKVDDFLIKLVVGKETLAEKKVPYTKGGFQVELIVPIKPRTRHDATLQIVSLSDTKEYICSTISVSFRK
jgi:hypothetical protein